MTENKTITKIKRRIVSVLLAVLMIFAILPTQTFAEGVSSEDGWEKVYYYMEKEVYQDNSPYRIEIYSNTVEGNFFFVIPTFTTKLRFLVYSDNKICGDYTAETTTWFSKRDLKHIMNKDDALSGVYHYYERLLQAECRLMVLDDIANTGVNTAAEEHKKSLAALRASTLGGFQDVISDYQQEMIEEMITAAIDTANSVFQSSQEEADPVIEFFKMLFFDLFGLGESDDESEDFSSHIAQMMGKNVFHALGGMTDILYDSVATISPAQAKAPYEAECKTCREAIANKIIELSANS